MQSLSFELQTKKKYRYDDKNDKFIFNRVGIFCLSFPDNQKVSSLWTFKMSQALQMYFSLSQYCKVELTYFPEEGQEIKIFRKKLRREM